MSRILIAEADAQARGGAEAYAAALDKMLRDRGHAVGHVDVRGHRSHDGRAEPLRTLPGRSLWNWAQVCRLLPVLAPRYDAVILAYGEGPRLAVPSLTIRHAPALFSGQSDLIKALGARAGPLRRAYAATCRQVAGLSSDTGPGAADRTLANSHWTAGLMAKMTEARAAGVLYPPLVAPPALSPPPRRRPFSIVTLGRLVPNKRVEDAIDLTEALRARGLPATLTVIGRGGTDYAAQIAARAKGHRHLTLLTDASDADRCRVLAEASLGFHGFRGEHFGIAVAEMILSGVAPMVHDSGGVCELVTDPALRFGTLDDAVIKAERLFCRPDLTLRIVRSLQTGAALTEALDFDRRAGAAVEHWLTLIGQETPRNAA